MTPDERDTVEREVRTAFDRLVDAARSLEAEAYLAHLDRERFTAFVEGRAVTSYDHFEAMYREAISALNAYVSLTFDPVHVTVVNRNTAVVVNEFTETLALASGDTLSLAGGGTQVWVRADSTWRLVHVAGSAHPVE